MASEDSQSLYPSGCDPSHIAKSTPIVKECSCPECRLVNSRIAPYGMILKHSKGLDSYGDMSISYLEASRVRILALQKLETAWQESEVSFFMRSSDCVAKLSLDLSFWKTYRPLLQEGDAKWLGPLPRWGMTVDGVLYQQRALERPIKRERWFILAHSQSERFKERGLPMREETTHAKPENCFKCFSWDKEPENRLELARVDDGIPFYVDRVKALGNAVVPAQAKEAFKTLMYGTGYKY